LALCRKVDISHCTGINNVTALGQVQNLTISFYNSYNINSSHDKKILQGLEALSHVTSLFLRGVDMAGLDIRCYVNVQKLTLDSCAKICAPLETFKILTTARDSMLSFKVIDSFFEDQTEKQIQNLFLNGSLDEEEEKFYFRLNKMSRTPKSVEVSDIVDRTFADY
jgi:hypothetical protein